MWTRTGPEKGYEMDQSVQFVLTRLTQNRKQRDYMWYLIIWHSEISEKRKDIKKKKKVQVPKENNLTGQIRLGLSLSVLSSAIHCWEKTEAAQRLATNFRTYKKALDSTGEDLYFLFLQNWKLLSQKSNMWFSMLSQVKNVFICGSSSSCYWPQTQGCIPKKQSKVLDFTILLIHYSSCKKCSLKSTN